MLSPHPATCGRRALGANLLPYRHYQNYFHRFKINIQFCSYTIIHIFSLSTFAHTWAIRSHKLDTYLQTCVHTYSNISLNLHAGFSAHKLHCALLSGINSVAGVYCFTPSETGRKWILFPYIKTVRPGIVHRITDKPCR